MERRLKFVLVGAVALAGLALAAPAASAIPLSGGASSLAVAPGTAPGVDHVRWVCNPFHCWWRPNYYAYYGVQPFFGGYGWHHGWHRGWGGGWGGGWHRRWQGW